MFLNLKSKIHVPRVINVQREFAKAATTRTSITFIMVFGFGVGVGVGVGARDMHIQQQRDGRWRVFACCALYLHLAIA
jgi:hypothetical protein